jgi:hypothetical protein
VTLQMLCRHALECMARAEAMSPNDLDNFYAFHVGYSLRADEPDCTVEYMREMVAGTAFYEGTPLGLETINAEFVEAKLSAAIKGDAGAKAYLLAHAAPMECRLVGPLERLGAERSLRA